MPGISGGSVALSSEQISGYAKAAGFSGNDLNVATAIALAESGGNPQAHNATPPDDSYGLWQINMLGSLGPSRRRTYGLTSNAQLYDPATNARVAYGIFKGSGFNAWTTYTSNAYKQHLTNSPNALQSAVATLNPVTGVTGAINAFGATLFKTGANIGGIAIAIVLLVLGIILLARSQIANIVPAGKAVKIAQGLTK